MTLPSATQLRQAVLRSEVAEVSILNLGCITRDWRVMHRGQAVPVVLGYAEPADYFPNPGYFGVIAGRVANRIGRARFALDGVSYDVSANEGPNTLHGGHLGLGGRIWNMEGDGDCAVRLTYHSPEGEEGFPGAVDFTVTISLTGGRLRYDMRAVPDRPTPINLAQHNYYNLMGGGLIWDHALRIAGSEYTPVDDALIPTGQIAGVEGTNFDYRAETTIGEADPDHLGADININLTPDARGPQVTLTAPNGLTLKMWTDEPGLQLYTGSGLPVRATPLPGQSHVRFGGVCLEPQHYPDSVNNPAFPSIICTPDAPYHQVLEVEVTPT